ncbi:Ras-related protein Rab-32 [Portunus trituberculatus]|uniref:Ras-related protein Rab-32 n=1 Tax=Portunus trituberculatus TaxID=210409 RepID=A0A5B7GW42_PORTR|nr:Ras-related protein Rab-32 [Portunus trituberculatus]
MGVTHRVARGWSWDADKCSSHDWTSRNLLWLPRYFASRMTAVAPLEHSTVPRELQFKVLVIGEFGVGKTAVIRRYTEGHFSPYYKLTIGVDFAVKTLDWDAKTKVTVQLCLEISVVQ